VAAFPGGSQAAGPTDRPTRWPLAASDWARDHGATAVEGNAILTEPFVEVTWGEAHVGPVQVFADAGFTEVSAPTKRRRVPRTDF
jgi:hypothetical protein